MQYFALFVIGVVLVIFFARALRHERGGNEQAPDDITSSTAANEEGIPISVQAMRTIKRPPPRHHPLDSIPIDEDLLRQKQEMIASIARQARINEDGTVTTAIGEESRDIYEGYTKAMEYVGAGDLEKATELLLQSVNPPSIYRGHYRELFKLFRQFNRQDATAKKWQSVIDRVEDMIRLDDEMVAEMLRYWSIQNARRLPSDHFDRDRNLRVSDVKALKRAAVALGMVGVEVKAQGLIEGFEKRRSELPL